MSNHFVRCSRCGKRVSNIVTVPEGDSWGLTVRAWVECPECIEKAPPAPDELLEQVWDLLNEATSHVESAAVEKDYFERFAAIDKIMTEREAASKQSPSR